MPVDPQTLDALRIRHEIERGYLESRIKEEIEASANAVRNAQDKTARLRAQLQIHALLLKEEAALFKQKSDLGIQARKELVKRHKAELKQVLGESANEN